MWRKFENKYVYTQTHDDPLKLDSTWTNSVEDNHSVYWFISSESQRQQLILTEACRVTKYSLHYDRMQITLMHNDNIRLCPSRDYDWHHMWWDSEKYVMSCLSQGSAAMRHLQDFWLQLNQCIRQRRVE